MLAHNSSVKMGKFIFINPQIRKRNLLSLLVSWIKFFFLEGIEWKKITPIRSWPFGMKRLLEILRVDALGIMSELPKENLVVIKGKNDNYFCDRESAEILKYNGYTVIEVDADHDWNENIAKTVASYINSVESIN